MLPCSWLESEIESKEGGKYSTSDTLKQVLALIVGIRNFSDRMIVNIMSHMQEHITFF
jgi:hypothetical protein